MIIGIGPCNQLVGIIGAAQLGQVTQHVVYAPRIGKILADGGEDATVAIIRFTVGIDVMRHLTILVEGTVGEVAVLTEVLDGTGITRPRACTGCILPLRLGGVIVGPALVSEAFTDSIELPFHNLGRYLVDAADARRQELRVFVAELLSTCVEEISLVAQSLVLADPEPPREGDLHRLRILEGLVAHHKSARGTPNKAETVLVDPLITRETPLLQNLGGSAHSGRLVLQGEGDLSRRDGIAKFINARWERAIRFQGLDQYIRHQWAELRSLQTGMKGSFARVETGKQLAPELSLSLAKQVLVLESGLGLVINAEAIDHHHVCPGGILA